MNEVKFVVVDDDVIDLGAASELTLGIDDPIMSEDLLHIRMRDFG